MLWLISHFPLIDKMTPKQFAVRAALWMTLVFSMASAASSVTYVSLSYDDALPSQLTHAIPALKKFGFKGAFYLVPSNPGFKEYQQKWADIARQGHELGNHSFTHPCRGSLPGRSWVPKANDLDTISVEEMEKQIIKANAALALLDGKQERTYTVPCGDVMASGKNYLPAIRNHIMAIKGLTLPADQEVILAPSDVSGDELIAMISGQPEQVKVINVIFHGVGGDYLSVSEDAHLALLTFLDANRDEYAVETYETIVERVRPKATTEAE